MENFVEFAILAVGLALSLGLALILEWLGLRGLMRLMPACTDSTFAGERVTPPVVQPAALPRMPVAPNFFRESVPENKE